MQRSEKKIERTFARIRRDIGVGEPDGIGSMIRPSDDYMVDTYHDDSMIMLQ